MGSSPTEPTVPIVLAVSTEDCGSSGTGSNPVGHPKNKKFFEKIKLLKRTFYIIIVIDNNKGHQVVTLRQVVQTVDKVERLLRVTELHDIC